MQQAEPETCEQCQRPKYSEADLERWRNEVAEITKSGGDPIKHNPEWARALCWTKREYPCGCRPIGEEGRRGT